MILTDYLCNQKGKASKLPTEAKMRKSRQEVLTLHEQKQGCRQEGTFTSLQSITQISHICNKKIPVTQKITTDRLTN